MPEENAAQTVVEKFLCRILTPEKVVFEGEIRALEAHDMQGSLEIYPQHEPLMTPLKIGTLSPEKWDRREGNPHLKFAIHGGFLDMNGKEAVVLANAAENMDDIDGDRARASLARAKEKLEAKSGPADEIEIDIDRAKLAIARAMNRISLIETDKPKE